MAGISHSGLTDTCTLRLVMAAVAVIRKITDRTGELCLVRFCGLMSILKRMEMNMAFPMTIRLPEMMRDFGRRFLHMASEIHGDSVLMLRPVTSGPVMWVRTISKR